MKKINLYLLSFFYVANGFFHFFFTESYLPIMPDFLPYHKELVLFSGVLEIGFGIGVLFDKFRNLSILGIVLILILFMSVHLNTALDVSKWESRKLQLIILAALSIVLYANTISILQ